MGGRTLRGAQGEEQGARSHPSTATATDHWDKVALQPCPTAPAAPAATGRAELGLFLPSPASAAASGHLLVPLLSEKAGFAL